MAYLGNLLIDNRHGLIVDAMATTADGLAERDAALIMLQGVDSAHVSGMGQRCAARLAAQIKAHESRQNLRWRRKPVASVAARTSRSRLTCDNCRV